MTQFVVHRAGGLLVAAPAVSKQVKKSIEERRLFTLDYSAAVQLDKIKPVLIEADGPTFDDLMKAIEQNEQSDRELAPKK